MPEEKTNILIVDDEQDIRERFVHFLRDAPYRVFEASDGINALEILKKNKIRACFLDIRMPGMDGLETLKRLKQLASCPAVVMMTAYHDTHQALQALNSGAVDYISKPFDIHQVTRFLEKYALNSKTQTRASPQPVLEFLGEDRREPPDPLPAKVLIVDDEKAILTLLTRGLQKAGMQVGAAGDGFEAIQEFKKNTYEVVFIDLNLPSMNGMDVIQAMKDLNPQVEFVVVTGQGSLESAQKALRMGAFDYLQKPLPEISEVVRIVERAIQRQRWHWAQNQTIRSLQRRVNELNTLYRLSSALSYSPDYNQLLQMIMESLQQTLSYDVGAYYLEDQSGPQFHVYLGRPVSEEVLERVRKNLLASFADLTHKTPDLQSMAFRLKRFYDPGALSDPSPVTALQTFLNIPLEAGDSVVAMINISAGREDAFSKEDVRILRTMIRQLSGSIERLRSVIAREKSLMEGMVESMVEGVIMIDEQGEMMILNPKAKQMLGFKEEEAVTSRALHEKLKVFELDKAILECQNSGDLVTREIIVPQKQTMILRSEASLVKNDQNEIIGLLLILRDITKEREVDRMKTEFISTVSHELRTPLSITKEGISLILDKIPGEINEKQERILTTARGNIDRLSRIINNLLDISKMEAGKVELKREFVNLSNLIKQVAATFERGIEERGLKFNLNLPADDVYLYVDADRMIQVLTNLIGNALKFTDKGFIGIDLKKTERAVECRVEDTGRGISKDDMPKLFSKFQQFGRIHGAGEKGTGLGLAISKEIVEMHHGKIWVESQPAAGLVDAFGHEGADAPVTKFSFTLPIYTVEDLYREHINGRIREAMKKAMKTSLVVIAMPAFQKLKERLPRERVDVILKEMETILRNCLRQQADVFFKDPTEALVLLGGCNKDNAKRVGERLGSALAEYLIGQKLDKQVKMSFGYATFPDEADHGDPLIDLARGDLQPQKD